MASFITCSNRTFALGLFVTAALLGRADTIIGVNDMQPLPTPWSVRTDVKGARDERLLTAPALLDMHELTVNPRLRGPHRILVGLHYEKTEGDQRYYGAAVHVRLDGEPYRVLMETRRPFEEREFKVADMTDRSLVLSTLSERPCFIDYIRFEPVSAEVLAAERRAREAPHERDVVGIDDVNVWMWLYTTRSEWDFRDNIGQHVYAGFNRVYWMANAGAVFYHSDVGTRYERDAREFTPRSGYMVEHFRPLESGVKAAHDLGVEIFGWYRLNNNFASKGHLEEMGAGLNSRFFMEHPEFRLLDARGKPHHSKYSFAYPEVRDYVRAICVEMVTKGVDGLILDLLRHPPLVGYEPPLVEAYQKEYGVDPRTISRRDEEAFLKWSSYRARHSFTQFVIELAQDLRRIGKPVPLGLRCSLAPFSWNRDNGMDVEDLVRRGLIQELCLMNGYLSRSELTHRPEEISMASQPYFDLVAGRDVTMICGLHGRSPAQTRTYAGFIHDAGYDGIAYYETDVHATRPDFVETFRTLKTRQTVTDPWLSASSARRDQMIPWQAAEQGPGWWQVVLPDRRALREVRTVFEPATEDVSVQLSASAMGDDWLTLPTRQEPGQLVLSDETPVRRVRVTLEPATGVSPVLKRASLRFADGTMNIGEVRDGRVKITSHEPGANVAPGAVFEATVAGNPSRSHVTFYWNGIPIRTEKQAPFTWYTPDTLRPGNHRLKVRLDDGDLSPSTHEIEVTVTGESPGFGPLPAGMQVLVADDFEEAPLGRCENLPAPWFFSKGYGKEETQQAPAGYAEIVEAGGSRALHLVWPGEGPRMKAHLPLPQPTKAGAVEFEIMVPAVRRPVLAGLNQGKELNLAMYLVDRGAKMTYNNGRNSHQTFSSNLPAKAGIWRRIRWEWEADTKRQSIFVDDMTEPKADDNGFRRPITSGIDSLLFFFFEEQPGELYIDNVRVLEPDQ